MCYHAVKGEEEGNCEEGDLLNQESRSGWPSTASHLPHLTATTGRGLCGGGRVLVSHLPPSLGLGWEGIPGTGYLRLG